MSRIARISYYLPEKILSNARLSEEFPEWSVDKIANKTGIIQRHIADENVCSSDLGFESSIRLFNEYNIDPQIIDYILFCTQSPDYFLPTSACLLQEKLGIPTSAGALDFNLGCSGFVYGLNLANALIKSGQSKNILLITAETYSKFIHPKDKSVRTIFGDGSASCLITESDEDQIGPFVLGTDGRGANNLIVKAGAFRLPGSKNDFKEENDEFGNVRSDAVLYMNGAEVFNFTLREVPVLIHQLLEKSNLALDDIDLFVFHQANSYMLETLRKKLDIPKEKFFMYLENVGNTVSATIPIALREAMNQNLIKAGTKVMLVGFGVGYSWAGTIVKF